MKILGAVVTWDNLEFFKLSLQQALDFCDEVIVVEGCHSLQFPRRSTDGTVEYLESISHPKLRVLNIDYTKLGLEDMRYDYIQCQIFNIINSSFASWQPGNWVIQWDDDIFWFNEDFKKIRAILETTDHDRIRFRQRKFTYNFRFNSWANGGIPFDRITEGCYYTPIARLHYKDGTLYSKHEKRIDMTTFHYINVKRPERMNARWMMSIEKGTSASKTRFEKWMGIEWKTDEDFLKNKNEIAFILGVKPDDVHVYNGSHPEILDGHPWRHIEDIRKLK